MSDITPAGAAIAPAVPVSAQNRTNPRNPAVQRCLNARLIRYHAELKAGGNHNTSESNANEAYRQAMPDLDGAQNISDFIACVTYGIILRAVTPFDSPQLLYAAQVALTAIRRQPQVPGQPGRPKNTALTVPAPAVTPLLEN